MSRPLRMLWDPSVNKYYYGWVISMYLSFFFFLYLEPRVKVEVPQSPEALEYAHFCLRNAYHALLGATAKNVTIQPQVNTANINFDWHSASNLFSFYLMVLLRKTRKVRKFTNHPLNTFRAK